MVIDRGYLTLEITTKLNKEKRVVSGEMQLVVKIW